MEMHRRSKALPSIAMSAALLIPAAHPMHAAPSTPAEQERVDARQNTPVAVRPSMLADNIEQLAGQHVLVLDARVVQVFAPNAFLIEPASSYEELRGQRARILVLIEGAALNVPAESLVAATVRIAGLARTLLGAQVSREVTWPVNLDQNLTQQLEVRAAVVANSVRTADGTELTACSSCTD